MRQFLRVLPFRRLATCLAVVSTLASTPTSRSLAQSPQEVAAQALPSVVVIVAEGTTGEQESSGSGFFVLPDIVATNLHVVAGAHRARVKVPGVETWLPVVGAVAADGQRDLVLLQVPSAIGRPLTLSEDHVAVGDAVYALGAPRGLAGTFAPGIVSAIRHTGSDALLQITAPVSPGSSGGPLLNPRGHVIGVIFAGVRDAQNLNFAIPTKFLSRLLQDRADARSLSVLSPPAGKEQGSSRTLVVALEVREDCRERPGRIPM